MTIAIKGATTIKGNTTVGFSPASLFASGEQGAWYDPSDLSTMFQDSAGTTPVTAVEQSVGRILDKSGRGNNATQSTSGQRPVLSARVNILSSTATLSTQSVTTLATNYTLYFEGTGTITLSGTKTGTYSSGSNSLTGVTAGTLTLTVSGTVTNADLRPTNQGVNLPVYQRVTSSTDYDTSGFPLYLRFNGTTANMVTGSIDMSAVNKSTAFCGMRKTNDTARQCIIEFGNLATPTAGFFFNAPLSPANKDVAWASAGSTGVTSSENNVGSPLSAVLTGIGDIAAPVATLRRNGAQVATSTSSQGTGNYGSQILYIGMRAGSVLYFNGNLYGLIVRGASSTADQITATENWLNQKTRAY